MFLYTICSDIDLNFYFIEHFLTFVIFSQTKLVNSLAEEYGDVRIIQSNLKEEYVKIQRKRVEGSQQRIENGLVYFTVFSFMQITNVRTFVQRLTDWANEIACNKLENGKTVLCCLQFHFSSIIYMPPIFPTKFSKGLISSCCCESPQTFKNH